MRIFKGAIILSLLLFFNGCASEEKVPKELYQDLLKEYKELSEATSATQTTYIQQAEQVDSILYALTQISGQTASIRMDVENHSGKISEIEQIQFNIDSIREKIEELEKQIENNKGLKKIISGLNRLVEEKDNEIAQLKKQINTQNQKIREQNETIQEQSGTINTQYQTILEQKKSLEKAVIRQAMMLYDAGVAFERLGDDAPEIRRKKDRAKVDNLTREMYENALKYYNDAYFAGYADAKDRISIVKRKISYL